MRSLLAALALTLFSAPALADIPPDKPKEDKSGCVAAGPAALAPMGLGLLALISLRRRG